MRKPASELQTFLARVRRRLTAARVAEGLGAGAAGGALAAAVIAGILLWQSRPAGEISMLLIAAGAAAGVGFGILRRPTLHAAAMEADRQLRSSDLFSTALSITNQASDPWRRTVISLADARARSTSPADVVALRWGSRAWAGVALSLLLVLTLNLFTAVRSEAGRADQRSAVVVRDDAPRAQERRDGGSAISRRGGGETATADGEESSDWQADGGDAGEHALRPTGEAAGGGDAASDVFRESGSEASALDGQNNGTIGEGDATRMMADRSSFARPAPWRSADWQHHATDAREQINANRVPAKYHDLIEGYFQP
jgi:hypothetical protein